VSSELREVAVIGLGNVLMGDDGVGVEVIRRLAEEGAPSGVRLIEGGTAIHEAIFDAEGAEKIIIVDSVHGGSEPGAIYRFTLDEIDHGSTPLAISLHDFSALPTIAMHRLAGRGAGDVVVIGVEPEKVEWGLGLSETIRSRLPKIIEAVKREISQVCPASSEEESK